MNVPFTINGGDEALEKKFLDEAKKHKLYTLAGHRSVGGCRASLYNGMPLEGVAKLTDFMKSFMDENRKWGPPWPVGFPCDCGFELVAQNGPTEILDANLWFQAFVSDSD